MELPYLLVPCQGRLPALPYQRDPSSQRVGTQWRETRGVSAPHCPPHFPKGLPCVPLGEGHPPHALWHVPHGPAAPALTGMDPSLLCLSVTLLVPAFSAALRCIPFVGMTLLALRAMLSQVGSGRILRAVCSGECRLLSRGPRGRGWGGLRCLHVISEGTWWVSAHSEVRPW